MLQRLSGSGREEWRYWKCVATAWRAPGRLSAAAPIVLSLRRAAGRGINPPYGVLVSAREAITLPVHPIVRPRGGDFCYTEEEFAAMLNDIRMVRDLGFPGLVTGVLDADGQVDIPRMKNNGRGGAAGGDLSSRVRSVCADPRQAWKTLGTLGLNVS